jgi:DNA-directed RNA polymerase specialized sigma24 family protein
MSAAPGETGRLRVVLIDADEKRRASRRLFVTHEAVGFYAWCLLDDPDAFRADPQSRPEHLRDAERTELCDWIAGLSSEQREAVSFEFETVELPG